MVAKKSLINCTSARIAPLCPHSPLAYLFDMSRVLIAGRLALYPNITMNKRFSSLLLSFVCCNTG